MEQIGQVMHEMVEAAREARERLKKGARPPASAEERMGARTAARSASTRLSNRAGRGGDRWDKGKLCRSNYPRVSRSKW